MVEIASSHHLAAAVPGETSTSGVTWSAIIAGAVAAAATALIPLVLGADLGLSAVSPWGQLRRVRDNDWRRRRHLAGCNSMAVGRTGRLSDRASEDQVGQRPYA